RFDSWQGRLYKRKMEIRLKIEGDKKSIEELKKQFENKGVDVKFILELSLEERAIASVKWLLEHPELVKVISDIILEWLRHNKENKIMGIDVKETIDNSDNKKTIQEKLSKIEKQRREFNEYVEKMKDKY
ncbi:MAG: hypothetical protein AABX84_01835, partial [Nanoarchaeota archaeon]